MGLRVFKGKSFSFFFLNKFLMGFHLILIFNGAKKKNYQRDFNYDH